MNREERYDAHPTDWLHVIVRNTRENNALLMPVPVPVPVEEDGGDFAIELSEKRLRTRDCQQSFRTQSMYAVFNSADDAMHVLTSRCDQQNNIHIGPFVHETKTDDDICTKCGMAWRSPDISADDRSMQEFMRIKQATVGVRADDANSEDFDAANGDKKQKIMHRRSASQRGGEQHTLYKSHTQKITPKTHGSSIYNPLQYFRDLLTHYNATDAPVPENVLDDLRAEFHKSGYTRRDEIALIPDSTLRSTLARLGHNTHYKSIPQIRMRITGIEPSRISLEEAELLVFQVDTIIKNWAQIRGASARTSMVRYVILLDFLCNLNKTPGYVRSGPVLLDSNKLHAIYRNILLPAVEAGLIPTRAAFEKRRAPSQP